MPGSPPVAAGCTRRGIRWTAGSRVVAIQRELRASDAEREAVVQRLQRAVGEGRRTLAEFQDRIEAAYAAKTHGELDEPTADQPRSIW